MPIRQSTFEFLEDVARFNELKSSLLGKVGIDPKIRFELIDRYDSLSLKIQRLRKDASLSPGQLSEMEERYFSCTNDLIGQMQVNPVLDRSFRLRYQDIWKANSYLFVFVFQLFCLSIFVGLYMGWFATEFSGLFLPQGIQEKILSHEDWFGSLRNNPFFGAVLIAVNNMTVCFNIFFLSAFLGIGGIVMLIFNAFNIGFMLSYCARYGFADVLVNFITTHGMLELTLMIVSCFSGLLMGKEFFKKSPEPFSKRFPRATKDGFIVALATAPWIFTAAIFEAFVSPWSYLSYETKFAVGAAIAALFWIYTFAPELTLKPKRRIDLGERA